MSGWGDLMGDYEEVVDESTGAGAGVEPLRAKDPLAGGDARDEFLVAHLQRHQQPHRDLWVTTPIRVTATNELRTTELIHFLLT